jgi:hypothetical protein
MVITEKKLDKFLIRMEKFVDDLCKMKRHDVQLYVDQYYYVQKIEELKVMKEELDEALKRTKFFQESIDSNYREISCRWRKDVQWFNKRQSNDSQASDAVETSPGSCGPCL